MLWLSTVRSRHASIERPLGRWRQLSQVDWRVTIADRSLGGRMEFAKAVTEDQWVRWSLPVPRWPTSQGDERRRSDRGQRV
jgi:hypothetical protein